MSDNNSVNPQLDTLVNRLVHATDPEEVKGIYRQWAATYNADLDSFGYIAPQIGTALFSQLVIDKNARIHDAGCGTGLVGKLLTAIGYNHIDGSDFSPDMLERANQTGCYHKLHKADYSLPIDLPDCCYDSVISIGVYSKRFKQHFLEEMLRITKPGGYFLFSCRPLYFKEVAERVTQLHINEVIEQSSVVKDDYMVGQNAMAFYNSLRKSQTTDLN